MADAVRKKLLPISRNIRRSSKLVRAGDQNSAYNLNILRQRLESFYSKNSQYFQRAQMNDKSEFYDSFAPHLRRLIKERNRINVLEVGAGRTMFAAWLADENMREKVKYAVQDVTPINQEYLQQCADQVIIADTSECMGDAAYDFIFCTFVYEHLVAPDKFIQSCLSALRSGGLLIIVCPKYVTPLYIPPALRHLSKLRQLWHNLRLVLSAAASRFTRRANFWIVTEPALFSCGSYRDADAIHMVSPTDLDIAVGKRAVRAKLGLRKTGLLDRVKSHLLLMAVAYEKS